VLGFALLQDGNVGVGIFPQREEILIGRLGLGGVALHGVGASHLKMRECASGQIPHETWVIKDALEFGGRL
jgi:hypothetical protein